MKKQFKPGDVIFVRMVVEKVDESIRNQGLPYRAGLKNGSNIWVSRDEIDGWLGDDMSEDKTND